MDTKLELSVCHFIEELGRHFPNVDVLVRYDELEDFLFLYHKSEFLDTIHEDFVNELLNVYFYDKDVNNVCFVYSLSQFRDAHKNRTLYVNIENISEISDFYIYICTYDSLGLLIA